MGKLPPTVIPAQSLPPTRLGAGIPVPSTTKDANHANTAFPTRIHTDEPGFLLTTGNGDGGLPADSASLEAERARQRRWSGPGQNRCEKTRHMNW